MRTGCKTAPLIVAKMSTRFFQDLHTPMCRVLSNYVNCRTVVRKLSWPKSVKLENKSIIVWGCIFPQFRKRLWEFTEWWILVNIESFFKQTLSPWCRNTIFCNKMASHVVFREKLRFWPRVLLFISLKKVFIYFFLKLTFLFFPFILR